MSITAYCWGGGKQKRVSIVIRGGKEEMKLLTLIGVTLTNNVMKHKLDNIIMLRFQLRVFKKDLTPNSRLRGEKKLPT